jgi:hypothetical protein
VGKKTLKGGGGRGCQASSIRATEAASTFDAEDSSREKGERENTSTTEI